MSETQVEPLPPTIPFQPDPEKRGRTEATLNELMRLMQLPGKHDIKEGAEGTLTVALFPEGEFPGIFVGRRSHVVEALQFILNKIVNRVGTDRRWISLGVGAHPPPRSFREKRTSVPGGEPSTGEPTTPREVRAQPPKARAAPTPVPASPRAAPALDEANLSVSVDPALTALGKLLATKAAKLGRFYAIAPMQPEDRARLLKATQDSPGVRVYAEGEGRNRRLVFAPEKPAPLPKRTAYPQDDDFEE